MNLDLGSEMNNTLVPEQGTARPGSRYVKDRGARAWRILHTPTGHAVPVPMGSEQCVKRAIEAVEGAIDWNTDDAQKIRDQVEEIGGWDSIRRMIAEAMAW